jgi:spermidine/putrescine transport system substrate-binding protein
MYRNLGGFIAAAAVAALAVGVADAAEKIVVSNWDAYMPPELPANFTKETGIEVDLVLHATNEDIVGKVSAVGGKGYDVIFVSGPFVEALQQLGLLADLDPAKVPNLANLFPQARDLPFDPGNKHSVPYTWGTTGLCYRSDVVKGEPASWMDLLQPSQQLERRVTMLATDRWLMAAGLKALGYSVNSKDPAEIAKAKDLLIAVKPKLLAYDDTTFYQKLLTGDADLVHAWDGWCNLGITDNSAIKFVIPKEGSDLFVDAMVVMAASEHKDAAQSFINYVLRPDVHASVMGFTLYKVPNQKGVELVDKALLEKYPPLAISADVLFQQEQLRDLGDAQPLYTKTVTEILAAQ